LGIISLSALVPRLIEISRQFSELSLDPQPPNLAAFGRKIIGRNSAEKKWLNGNPPNSKILPAAGNNSGYCGAG